jgi:hypothetical protein
MVCVIKVVDTVIAANPKIDVAKREMANMTQR